MKKIKILLPLTAISLVSASLLPLASCGCSMQEMITIDDKDKTQSLVNGTATFTFTLKENWKEDILKDPVLSNSKLSVQSWKIDGNKLYVVVVFASNEQSSQSFDITFEKKDGSYKQIIKDLKVTFEQCTINLSSNEHGKLVGETTLKVVKGTKFKNLSLPTPEVVTQNYKFWGWYNPTNYTWIDEETYVVESDLNLIAMFLLDGEQKNLKLTVDSKSENFPIIAGYTFGNFKTAYEIENPTKEGYDFNTWKNSKTKQPMVDDEKIYDDVEVYAEFIKLCTINVSASDGVTLSSTQPLSIREGTKWGDVKNKPTASVPSGWTDLGWYNINNYTWVDDNTVVNSDSDFKYIAFKEELVNVKIIIDGTWSDPLYHISGKTFGEFREYYEIPAKPEVAGKIFTGWQINGGQDIDDNYVISKSVEIAAVHKTAMTLTFTASEGVTLEGSTEITIINDQKWSDIIKPTATYDKEAYYGFGWYDVTNERWMEDSFSVKGNTQFKYVALANEEFVNVKINDGTKTVTNPHVKGLTFNDFKNYYEIQDPHKQGYKFEGWFKEGTSTEVKGTDVINDNISIEAKFVEDINFTTDSWETVCSWANQGLDKLKEHYGLTTFIGLERIANINGQPHRVRVIGENHDELADGSGKKAALTFELVNILTDEDGKGLRTQWDRNGEHPLDYSQSVFEWALETDEKGTEYHTYNWVVGSSKPTGPKSSNHYIATYMLNKRSDTQAIYNNLKLVKKSTIPTLESGEGLSKNPTKYEAWAFPISATEMGLRNLEGEGATYEYWAKHTQASDRIRTTVTGEKIPYWLSSICDDTRYLNRALEIQTDGSLNQEHVATYVSGTVYCFCI